MTERMTTGGLDFEALRRAIERRDVEALLDFYADDGGLDIYHFEILPGAGASGLPTGTTSIAAAKGAAPR